MVTRTMDEVKSNHVAVMGPELGEVYFGLYRSIVELHIVWQQYRELFASGNDVIKILNNGTGLFFKIVQDELWDSVLLRISRLVDPDKQRNNENLCLRSIIKLIDDLELKSRYMKSCDEVKELAVNMLEHRNKRIAHFDISNLSKHNSTTLAGVSRQDIEEILEKIRFTLNLINKHFHDAETMYQHFAAETGARRLIGKLRRIEGLPTQ